MMNKLNRTRAWMWFGRFFAVVFTLMVVVDLQPSGNKWMLILHIPSLVAAIVFAKGDAAEVSRLKKERELDNE